MAKEPYMILTEASKHRKIDRGTQTQTCRRRQNPIIHQIQTGLKDEHAKKVGHERQRHRDYNRHTN